MPSNGPSPRPGPDVSAGLFELRKDPITSWWVATIVDRAFHRDRFARAAEPVGVPTPVDDTGSRGSASRPIDLRTAPRMVVEAIADDDGWDDAADESAGGTPTSGDQPAKARDRGGA